MAHRRWRAATVEGAESPSCITGSCIPLATRRRHQIHVGLRLKLLQAARIAEVIRLAFVLKLAGRFGRINHHAAYRIANTVVVRYAHDWVDVPLVFQARGLQSLGLCDV